MMRPHLHLLTKHALVLSLTTLSLLASQRQSEAGFVIINDALFMTDRFFTAANSIYYTFKDTPLRLSAHIDIYTPRRQDLYLPVPPEGVHPYGGYMYGQAIYTQTLDDLIFQYTLQVGVTGEASHAHQFQDWWHSIIGRPLYQGWATQIGSTLGVQATIESRYIIDLDQIIVAPLVNVDIGVLLNTQSIGLRVIGGHGFSKEFVYLEKKEGFTFTGFFDLRFVHVSTNVFLSGFDSYKYAVTALPFLGEGILSFDLRWDDLGILFENHFQTPSYTTQMSGHTYANIALYTRF